MEHEPVLYTIADNLMLVRNATFYYVATSTTEPLAIQKFMSDNDTEYVGTTSSSGNNDRHTHKKTTATLAMHECRGLITNLIW